MKLIQGIEAFQNSIQADMQDRFSELEGGQSPETLFITCSDSRISPNLLTQTQPGEIFVIRNAGNMVPKPGTGELAIEATIQYAIEVLKVSHVVVCGHAKCGAVGGLLNLDSLTGFPAIHEYVSKSKQVLDTVADCDEDSKLDEAIKANVMLQLENLKCYDYVKSACDAGNLELHGWVYHFGSGHVDYLTAQNNMV